MFKDFLNLPMGRLVTVEALPHYQVCLTFQSASQGNVNMILNVDDVNAFINMLMKARTSSENTPDTDEDEDEAV